MPNASYDSNGDIILPIRSPTKAVGAQRAAKEETQEWTVTTSRRHEHLERLRKEAKAGAGMLAAESKDQFRESLTNARDALQNTKKDLLRTLKAAKEFLFQPVWLPGKRASAKHRTRVSLFAGDVLRFGTTFASLFAALFVALNYQSIWSITSALVDPLSAAQTTEKLSQTLKTSAVEKAAAQEGNLLSMLPLVGPPENRLVIPKLGLNVPIVTPSTEALLAEDWKKLEEDIQTSLQDGVVQYPGTARPGQAGNTFITGHSSYYPGMPGNFKSVFARLPELEPGDEYVIYYGGDKHRYRVIEKKEVKPSDVSVLDQPTSKREGTLMTCTPIGTTLRRLVVRAEEVDPLTGEPLEVGEHMAKPEHPTVRTEMLPI